MESALRAAFAFGPGSCQASLVGCVLTSDSGQPYGRATDDGGFGSVGFERLYVLSVYARREMYLCSCSEEQVDERGGELLVVERSASKCG